MISINYRGNVNKLSTTARVKSLVAKVATAVPLPYESTDNGSLQDLRFYSLT